MNTLQERNIFCVSQLNRRAKQLLETHLPMAWVAGEISNLTRHSSGHWYFSLKDDQAQVRCAMFRSANQRLRWKPETGDQVIVRSRVSLYEGRGDYQLIVEHMEATGSGLLQQEFEATKAKLAAEGLFDSNKKQSLPAFPKHIGIITSPTGAAIHDILTILKRRYPIATVTLVLVSVQGKKAHTEMISAIDKLEAFGQCDVVIIGRGGGSIEDLWAFNNEQLARKIAACVTPIVSAVGHEIDTTISDFVADLRAPTPTAAAELVSPDISEWIQFFDYQYEQLQQRIQQRLSQHQQQLTSLEKQLRHPKEKLNTLKQLLLQNYQRLLQAMLNKQKHKQQQLISLQKRLRHPKEKLSSLQHRVEQLHHRLQQAIDRQHQRKYEQLQHTTALLDSVSPIAVLSRGYSITRKKNGNIIKNSKQLQNGDEITTLLSTGKVISVIKGLKDSH